MIANSCVMDDAGCCKDVVTAFVFFSSFSATSRSPDNARYVRVLSKILAIELPSPEKEFLDGI